VNVKTIDGKKVSIRIPAGTPSGKRFRVRGQGVPKGAGAAATSDEQGGGDLIVEVEIVVPEKLTEEQERMMREFAESGGLKY
jgi:molecular chaperone DnaJ